MKKGKLIVFEGIDGSGKSTQVELVCEQLCKSFNTFQTAQPTKSELGLLLRRYLTGELVASNLVLTTLFASDRLNHVLEEGGLLDRINRGEIIICDRNYFSSFAYQASDDDFVFDVNSKAREILKPDLHIFIDVSVDVALDRISNGRDSFDIFETSDKLNAIKSNYLKSFDSLKNEENIVIINGDNPKEEVFSSILEEIYKIL